MNDETPEPAAQPAAHAEVRAPAGLNQAAIDWAWAQPIANNPGARIVLLCLARRVDEAWECEASQEEVAVDAMLSSRTVRRQLEQLAADGLVARLRRFDEKGHRLPDRCRVNPDLALPDNLSSRDSGSSEPQDNLSGRESAYRTDCPEVNVSSGSDQGQPDAALPDNLTGGQDGLWSDCPVGDGSEPQKGSSEPQDNLSGRKSGTRESSSSKKKNKKENLSSSEIREDVEELCARLLGWLETKNYRPRPSSVSDAWRTEARLLLDKDGIELAEALAVLDWSQRDHFWRTNIHSMPKFREKYGDLELKSRDRRSGASPSAPHPAQGNGSGSGVPPRGKPRQNPFLNKRRPA